MSGVDFNNSVVTQQQQQQIQRTVQQQQQQTQQNDATRNASGTGTVSGGGPLSSANALLQKSEEDKEKAKSGGAPLTLNALSDVGPQLFATFKSLITGTQAQETNHENAQLPQGASTEVAAPVKKEVINPVAQTISQNTGTNLNVNENPANDPRSAEGADKAKKGANVNTTVTNNDQNPNVQGIAK
jgi:hypothetical protein